MKKTLLRTQGDVDALHARIKQRAELLVDKVEWLGGTRYRVPSQSTEGKAYTVDMRYETCECESYRQLNNMPIGAPKGRPVRCKHIHAVAMRNQRARERSRQGK